MLQKEKEYHTVAIPKSLKQRIEKLIAGRLGYMSVSDFVREAIREKLSREETRLELEEFKAEKESEDIDTEM